MPYEEADASDPMARRAVPLPDDGTLRRDMVAGIADEYAREGFDGERIMQLFSDPFYAMTHAIWLEEGDEVVRSIVQQTVQKWGGPKLEQTVATDTNDIEPRE